MASTIAVLKKNEPTTSTAAQERTLLSISEKQPEIVLKEEPDLITLDSKKNSPEMKTKIIISPVTETHSNRSSTSTPQFVLMPAPEESWDNLSRRSVDSIDSYVHPDKDSKRAFIDAELSADETDDKNLTQNEEDTSEYEEKKCDIIDYGKFSETCTGASTSKISQSYSLEKINDQEERSTSSTSQRPIETYDLTSAPSGSTEMSAGDLLNEKETEYSETTLESQERKIHMENVKSTPADFPQTIKKEPLNFDRNSSLLSPPVRYHFSHLQTNHKVSVFQILL